MSLSLAHARHSGAGQSGLSLVELMVAMLVGLVLLGGVVSVYTSSRESNRMAESLARLQENGRFASALLAREIRMAGFMPCRINGEITNVLNTVSGGPVSSYTGDAIVGVESALGDFPATGTNPGDRVAGTDALWIQGGGNETLQVNDHQPSASSAAFFVEDINTLEDGDVVLVCDTEQASVFQVTNTNQANETVVHNTGGSVSPGNCVKQLGASSDPCTSPQAYTYGSDATMVKFRSQGYFIGVSSDGDSRSLYRRELDAAAGTYSNRELVEGIEDFQLQYGLDLDNDGQVERYLSADAINTAGHDWGLVRSARFGLLVRSEQEVRDTADTRSYNLAGTVIGPDGGSPSTGTHPEDERLRHAFNMTVQIRNRGL